MPAKSIRPPCNKNCRLKCKDKVNEEIRAKIFKKFWDLKDVNRQRDFISKSMQAVNPEYRYKKPNSTRRLNSAFYFFVDDQSIRVCKTFYIQRFIHFCDNDKIQPGDKMAKIRPIFDKMNDLFLLFAPGENELSIDESMIPYFGRYSCKQFIRGKPISFGFKAWVLAARNGYCLQADVYQGKKQ